MTIKVTITDVGGSVATAQSIITVVKGHGHSGGLVDGNEDQDSDTEAGDLGPDASA